MHAANGLPEQSRLNVISISNNLSKFLRPRTSTKATVLISLQASRLLIGSTMDVAQIRMLLPVCAPEPIVSLINV